MSKRSPYTRRFSDMQLIYQEKFQNQHSAEKREKQLKGWSIAKKKALISGNIAALKKLSKSPAIGEVFVGNE